jgi:hypothetical protein
MQYLTRVFWSVLGEITSCVLVVTVLAVIGVSWEEGFFDGDDPIGVTFGCGEPCTITFSRGGVAERFDRTADAALRGERKQIRIDGLCASACASFADKARDRVCITERARFGFHKGIEMSFNFRSGFEYAREDPPLSESVVKWIHQHGGFPSDGLLIMDAREASRFWRLCDTDASPPHRP